MVLVGWVSYVSEGPVVIAAVVAPVRGLQARGCLVLPAELPVEAFGHDLGQWLSFDVMLEPPSGGDVADHENSTSAVGES